MRITILSVLSIMLILSGCAFRKRERPDPDSGIGLSGSFSAKDSPLVAREISLEITSHPWLQQFHGSRQRSPVIMIGILTNESYQTIDMDLFARQLMHEILSAGELRFVEELPVPLRERSEPSLDLAKELAADFYLTAIVHTAEQQYKSKRIRYLQLDMKLLEVATGQPVWTILRPIRQNPTQGAAQ